MTGAGSSDGRVAMTNRKAPASLPPSAAELNARHRAAIHRVRIQRWNDQPVSRVPQPGDDDARVPKMGNAEWLRLVVAKP